MNFASDKSDGLASSNVRASGGHSFHSPLKSKELHNLSHKMFSDETMKKVSP